MNEYVQLYDICMVVVLVVCLVVGVWKGVAWQLAALASVVVSGFVAMGGGAALAPYFGVNDPWNRVCAILVIYVVTSGGIWLVFRLVSSIIDRVHLKEFDRQLGALFGLAKGVIYCLLLTFFAVTLSEPARQIVLQSRSGLYISRLIHKANPILPPDVHALLGKYIDQLDAKLTPSPQDTVKAAAMSQLPPPSQAAASLLKGQSTPAGGVAGGQVSGDSKGSF